MALVEGAARRQPCKLSSPPSLPPPSTAPRFYNGNARMEAGAVVCRVARSFIRFGTFQLPAARGEGQVHLVEQLVEYVIKHHYPHLHGEVGARGLGLGERGKAGGLWADKPP